jgi:hypothetical protein
MRAWNGTERKADENTGVSIIIVPRVPFLFLRRRAGADPVGNGLPPGMLGPRRGVVANDAGAGKQPRRPARAQGCVDAGWTAGGGMGMCRLTIPGSPPPRRTRSPMCARHVPCLPRQSAPPPPRHRGKRETSRPEQAAAGSARRTAYGLCSICPPRFVVRLAHGGFGPIVLRHEALSTSLLACWKQAIDRLPVLSVLPFVLCRIDLRLRLLCRRSDCIAVADLRYWNLPRASCYSPISLQFFLFSTNFVIRYRFLRFLFLY